MSHFIPLSIPNLSGREKQYVDDAIDKQWVSTGGAYITKMEQMVADFVKAPEAVACQSGTSALHLALVCCGVGAGDEVIVPTLTFIAAVNPVVYAGAQPVFMDCDDTLCMDMDKLERFCNEQCDMRDGVLHNRQTNKRIAAVLVVHVFGNIANMDKLLALKQQFGFKVIEDATEALGSSLASGQFAGQFAGTLGDMGAYSFNGNKIITTGGGGMLVANDLALLAHARYLSTQAKDDAIRFIHNEIGYNYRMTNVQAAIGVGQMEQLAEFIETKARNYQGYLQAGIDLLPFRPDISANFWFYSYMTDRRDELIAYLDAKKIQSRPVWYLIHQLPPYLHCQSYEIEKAVDYWQRIVNIPCSTNLPAEDVKLVAEVIKQFETTTACSGKA
jgi:perosamine synthetase